MDVYITHISTACVLLEIGSVRILTDPVFDTGVEEYRAGPGAWFTRSEGPALTPDEVRNLDAVLLSHPHHSDNLDETGRRITANAREVITALEEVRAFPERRITGLRAWSKTTIFGRGGEEIAVTATPALHGPRFLPGVRNVRGYILEWAGQEYGPLYISGDTIYHKALRDLAQWRIGTAILHLGAANFWPPYPPFIRFTFNGKEAARLARELGPGLRQIIPIHYEQSTWSHFKEDAASYHRAFQKAGVGEKLWWLRRGERTAITI